MLLTDNAVGYPRAYGSCQEWLVLWEDGPMFWDWNPHATPVVSLYSEAEVKHLLVAQHPLPEAWYQRLVDYARHRAQYADYPSLKGLQHATDG